MYKPTPDALRRTLPINPLRCGAYPRSAGGHAALVPLDAARNRDDRATAGPSRHAVSIKQQVFAAPNAAMPAWLEGDG